LSGLFLAKSLIRTRRGDMGRDGWDSGMMNMPYTLCVTLYLFSYQSACLRRPTAVFEHGWATLEPVRWPKATFRAAVCFCHPLVLNHQS